VNNPYTIRKKARKGRRAKPPLPDPMTTVSPPRRILFVAPVGEKGGAEQVLVDIVRGLDRVRFTPLVVCLKPGPLVDELRALGVFAVGLRSHQTRQIHRVAGALRALARIVRAEKVDVLHANGGTMLFYAALGARLAGAKIPVVWSVYDPLHGGGAFERAFVAAQRRLRPAWTIFGTPAVAPTYEQSYARLVAGRSQTILPGVNIADMEAGADAARARRDWGIPPDAPIATLFARLQPSKGHADLIEAAACVLAAHADTHFLLCGGALFGLHPGYEDEIRALIAARNLSARVRLTGYVPDAQKKDLLAAATLIVHPARSEPFGIALIEAMAAGKPVIATACDGPRTIVVPGETGLLVPPGDTNALAAAINALLAAPDQARRMGERGRERAQRRYSVAAMVTQVEKVYDAVLHERHNHVR